MLTENQLSKYIIYAIGEIFLVVIGILIALWINNNNIQNQNREKERLSLIEIRDNLISDTLQIDNNLKHIENRQGVIIKTLELLSKEKLNPKDIDSLFFYSSSGRLYNNATFKSNNVGFTNMVSSGNIDLLSNTELRKKLSEYYLINNDEFGGYEMTKIVSRNFQNYITPLIINIWSTRNPFDLDLPLEEFDIKLIQTPQTFGYLAQLLGNMDFSVKTSIDLKKNIISLIEITKNELGRLEK